MLVGVSPAAVSQYETGRARPSAAVVARLALVLGFPVGFFESGRPLNSVSTDAAHFRRLRASSQGSRARLVARLAILDELVSLVEREVELPPVDLLEAPDTGVDRASIEALADDVREKWGLGRGPISHMVRLLESRGVIVVRLDAGDETVDAFSRWTGARPAVVLTADKRDTARSRFDGAHELGHLLMHNDAVPGSPDHEFAANAFAAAFLLPASQFTQEFPGRVDWRRLVDLKVRWRVSIQALLYRGRTLSLLSEPAYKRAMVRMSALNWRRDEPGDLGEPEDAAMLAAALQALEDARSLGRKELATTLRVPVDVIEELVPTTSRPLLQVAVAPSHGAGTTTINIDRS